MSTIITAQMVGDLREKTGAGLLDCKKALTEANGNVEEAITILRKRGAASAAKKAERATREGLIESYIHVGGKVGVMIEVNCETDFVARTDEFKTLCRDLCLQIAAANPAYVRREEVPGGRCGQGARDRRGPGGGQAAGGNPEDHRRQTGEVLFHGLPARPAVRETAGEIGEGHLTEKVAKIGENIQVRRFVRFQLGA